MKWTVGDVEIFHIIELDQAAGPIQQGIKQATPENLQQMDWLYPNFVDKDGNFKSIVASFLLKSEKNILVDTCNGNDKIRPDLPEWGKLKTNFLKKLRSSGVDETQIDIVINTHLHCDHVGWNTTLKNGSWKPTFPNATYLFVKDDYDYWVQKPEKEFQDDKNAFQDSVQPIVDAGLAEFVSSDYKIDRYVSLIPTPGHTPGHVSIWIESKNNKVLIAGDLLHHPCQIFHPEWSSEYDNLPDKAIATRKKIYAEVANTNILFIGSHFAAPVAGKIIRKNGSYIFV